MRIKRKPKFRIWVEGYPQSFQKKRKERYMEKVKAAAQSVVPNPTSSNRIDIEIYFHSNQGIRADVDNIIKPVLDAMIGTVYLDDSQVRSVKAVAIPFNEPYSLSAGEWSSREVLEKLFSTDPVYFLINIYSGLAVPGGLGV